MEMRRFELTNEQIEFLKEMYPDNELVQRVLSPVLRIIRRSMMKSMKKLLESKLLREPK